MTKTIQQLKDEVACLERELALRRNVYPKWVANGKMTDEKADWEITQMAGALESVRKVLYCAEISEEIVLDQPFR
jgi:hypothetical protein